MEAIGATGWLQRLIDREEFCWFKYVWTKRQNFPFWPDWADRFEPLLEYPKRGVMQDATSVPGRLSIVTINLIGIHSQVPGSLS